MKKNYALTAAHRIQEAIFIIRGQRVLLDRTLAALYGTETRSLNQAVRRNLNRFPPDFMFALTRSEIMDLSQSVTGSTIKHAPSVFAFTQEGVAMLSSVLRSPRAIEVNIAIMRAFVRLREFIGTHKELAFKLRELERKVEQHDANIQTIFTAIKQLTKPEHKPKRQIGFHA